MASCASACFQLAVTWPSTRHQSAFGTAAEAAFLGAIAGCLRCRGRPAIGSFDHRVVVGKVAAVLDDLAQLVVQRFDDVGTRYEKRRGSACCCVLAWRLEPGHTV
jgi:hypothetical protein